jgi:hypothetical protein
MKPRRDGGDAGLIHEALLELRDFRRRVFGLGAGSTKFNQFDYRFAFTPNYGLAPGRLGRST